MYCIVQIDLSFSLLVVDHFHYPIVEVIFFIAFFIEFILTYERIKLTYLTFFV
jgi:hypothetical protein